MLEESNDDDVQVVIWKKILFLQRVLMTPLATGVRWSFTSRCEHVMNDNWDVFKTGIFKTRTYFTNDQMNKAVQDKVKIKKSRSLLEMGEISRSYRTLDADLESQKTAEELVQLYKDKLGILKEGTVVNDIPNNNRGIIISPECVREVIKQCGKGVSNSAITSNHRETQYYQDL